tara:strand:+ start:135 stop:911 length:777 start_codon:yes stop_codon:yes gene_type:complete
MALYGDGSNVNKTVSVSAGNYGGSSAVPVITVDSNQRISAINTASITLTAAINANASVGDVGTYAFMQQSSGNTTYNPGATLAGSSLRYSDATGRTHSTTPSGNWRCMGYDSGAALVNSGSGTGSGSGSGNISGNIQGNLSGNLQGGNVQGNSNFSGSGGLQGGNVQGNTNASIQAGNPQLQGPRTKGAQVGTDHLGVGGNVSVSGNVSTDHLGVGGSVNVGGDNTNVGGNASVNVTVNSVSVNTTVAYSATLWLRYS